MAASYSEIMITTICVGIIQDFITKSSPIPGAWHSESRKMSQIYGNSLLTIVAGAGAECWSGCFKHLSRLRTWPVRAFTADSDQNTFIFADRSTTGDGVRGIEEIDTRAWTFQEQLLSLWVLTFSKSEVFWDCL
jgi:hypothetical protein